MPSVDSEWRCDGTGRSRTFTPIILRLRSGQALGSASVLTDASGHEVAGTRLRYYPFGAPRPDGATGAHNAFATGYSDATFTGQRRDVGTGLTFY